MSKHPGLARGKWFVPRHTYTCGRCHKPIISVGRCYTCATGRPRVLIRRPDEPVKQAAA